MTSKLFLTIRGPLIAIALVIGMTGTARADLLTGDMTTEGLRSFFRFTADGKYRFAAPIEGKNITTDQWMNMFCMDYYTFTTPNFEKPKVGQPYDPIALNSPAMTLYSDTQKAALNSLFSHVYMTLVDSYDNLYYNAASWAFQLAVWEIVHETSGKWSLSSGSFGISSAATYNRPDLTGGYQTNSTLYLNVIALTNSWFAAIADESLWGPNYQKTDLELTVYVAEGGTHVSQTLISTVGPPKEPEIPEPSPTPEPASMLIFSTGLFVLPLVHRLRKNRVPLI